MPYELPIYVQYLDALADALAVPAIAVFGGYIAYRQWRTAQERVKLDLFDRRLEAYDRLREAVAPVMASGKVSNVDSDNFAAAIRDMRFLFDRETEAFVDQIFKAMLDKHVLEYEVERASGEKKKGLIERDSKLFTQITNGIYGEMPERMERFMRFRL